MNQYSTMDVTEEYVPVGPSTASMMSYTASVPTQINQSTSEPSKLAQLTDEELLRLVPDGIDY